MPRKQKKYHYTYKTTCDVSGRYYVGMHSTDDLDDGYLGSGKRLWYSINKHGKDNHRLEILEFFDSREKLRVREAELVDEDMLQDPMCMNLMPGGEGGFVSAEVQFKRSRAGGLAREQNISEERKHSICSMGGKKSVELGVGLHGPNNKRFEGKTHTEDTKARIGEKMQQVQAGKKNSQFGTCWINNGVISKRVKRTDSLDEGWVYGMGEDVKAKIRAKLIKSTR